MSNALGIAAVTATLQNMIRGVLEPEYAGIEVTTKPPDKVRSAGNSPNQVNLFLYHTTFNAAWRNMDMPRQVRSGETARPPLALELHYLVTAYGENDEEIRSQHLLGLAMSVLDDFPVLGSDDVNRILLPASNLHEQVERVRITSQPLSLDEMSKLWTTFQTQYRLSAGYQVSAVLIESNRPAKAALPVLRRGEKDRGASASTGMAPVLKQVRLPRSQPAVRLGEDIVLVGKQLEITDTVARFTSLRLDEQPELLLVKTANADELQVHFPDITEDADGMSHWTPGFYTVALVTRHDGLPAFTSNELAVALAPQITVQPLDRAVGQPLTITCTPRIVARQRVLLLLGDRQVEAQDITNPVDVTQPTSLTFVVPQLDAGSYVVRLRVDGVDSLPVIYDPVSGLPAFDPDQQVTIA